MKRFLSGLLAFSLALNAFAGSKDNYDTLARHASARFMSARSAIEVSPDHYRSQTAAYGPLKISTLRELTPLASAEDNAFIGELNKEFNPRGHDDIRNGIEAFVRRYEWVLTLAKNGHLDQARAEYDDVVVGMAKLQINMYRKAKDKEIAKSAIVRLNDRVNNYLFTHTVGLNAGQRQRLKGLEETVRARLDRPESFSRIQREMYEADLNPGVFMTFLPLSLAATGLAVATFNNSELGYWFADTSLISNNVRFMVGCSAVLGGITGSVFASIKVASTLNVYNRKVKKALSKETLSLIASSLRGRTPRGIGASAATPSANATDVKAAPEAESKLFSNTALADFLVSNIPQYNGADEFFRKTLADDALLFQYDAVLNGDSRFKAEIERGREARAIYLNLLREDFGRDSALTLQPEEELVRFLRRPRTGTDRRVEEIPDHVARQRALGDAVLQFGLPPDTTSDQLSEADPVVERYFMKRYFVHGLEEESKVAAPSLESLIRYLKNKVDSLRVENFHGAIRLANEIFPSNQEFYLENKLTSISTKDLTGAKIEIVAANQSRRNAFYQRQVRAISTRLHDYFSRTWIPRMRGDKSNAKEHYTTVTREPIFTGRNVKITMANRTLIIGESDWHRLLLNLHPVIEESSEDLQMRMKSRYLLEASRRDSLFSDLHSFISEGSYKDQSDLEKHLLSRVGLHDRDPAELRALTTRLEGTETLDEKTTAMNALRWSGFREHPNHWAVRDQVAQKLKRVWYKSALESPTRSSKIGSVITRVNEKLVGPSRTSTRKRRESVAAAALFGSILAYSSLGIGTLTGGTMLLEKASEHAPAPPVPGVPDLGVSASAMYNVASLLPPMPSSSAHNAPDIDGSSNETGNVGEPGATKAETAPFEVENSEVDPSLLPKFFATASKTNFGDYSKYEKDTDKDEEPAGTEALEYSQARTVFTVRTNGNVHAVDKRLPIVIPAGYAISDFHLYVDGEEWSAGDNYQIYTLPGTELPYVKLSHELPYFPKITYRVSYAQLDNASAEQSVLGLKADRQKIKTEIGSLRDLGASELADKLDQLLQRSGDLNLAEISNVFPETGLYTYSKEGWGTWKTSNPYNDFGRFLRADTINGKPTGRFYYQCTGSNGLEAVFLRRVFGRSADFEEINLLQRSDDGLDIGAKPGHRQTVAIDPSLEHGHVIIDATPYKMDPKYADRYDSPVVPERKREEPKKQKPQPLEKKAPSETAARIEDRMELQRVKSNSGDGNRRERERLKKIADLTTMLGDANSLVSDHREHGTKLEDLARAPGTSTLAIGAVVLEFAQGHMDPMTALVRVLALKHGVSLSDKQARKTIETLAHKMTGYQGAESAIAKVMRDNLNDVNALALKIDQHPEKIKGASTVLLADGVIRLRIERLAQFLAAADFQPPRVTPKLPMSCSALFSKL